MPGWGGVLDYDTVPDLYRETEALFSARRTLTLDVSAVERISRIGVALLLEWLAEARRRGCGLSLRGVPASVRAVARLCGVDYLLPAAAASCSDR